MFYKMFFLQRRRRAARTLLTALFALVLMTVSLPSMEAETDPASFPGLRALITAEDFRRFGLHRLEPAQLQALDGWLRDYLAGDAPEEGRTGAAAEPEPEPVAASTSASVTESADVGLPSRAREKKWEQVTARLSDDFRGWDGNTVFILDNGQIWRQRVEGRYHYRGPDNPEVVIKRNLLGFFQMTLVDKGRGVGVKRIR